MQTIYLDISNKGVIPTIYAKQHDVGRKFRAVLTDGGVPYNEAENSAFSVWYEGASGEGNYTHIGDESAFSVNGNVVEVELIEQMLANYGNTIACLVMSSANSGQIATWNIQITAETVPGFDSEPAEEYFTAFSQTASQVKRDADRAEAAATSFVVDDTLSISGASADAAVTGNEINDLRNSIDELPSQIVDNTLSEEGKAADAAEVGVRLSAVTDLVKIAAPVNILDNSDWTNPVNQRGQNSYSSSSKEAYTIDRWKAAANNLTNILLVQDGYVTINYTTGSPWIKQYFEANTLTVGKAYTIAVWLLDGTVGAASAVVPAVGSAAVNTPIITGALKGKLSHNTVELILWKDAMDIKYVALFEGEYTAETLPEYHPKGYGAELAECQRYYQIRSTNNVSGKDLRPTMRLDSPTITSVSGGYAYSADL